MNASVFPLWVFNIIKLTKMRSGEIRDWVNNFPSFLLVPKDGENKCLAISIVRIKKWAEVNHKIMLIFKSLFFDEKNDFSNFILDLTGTGLIAA